MLDSLSHSTLILTLAILHCIIGTIAAFIAHQKGRNFPRWLIIGLIAGTPSLIVALWLKPVSVD